MIKENNIASLVNVSKIYTNNYNEVSALSDVTIDAFKGNLSLILGPSGSGKTTLLMLMSGLLKPSSGVAFLFEQNIEKYKPGDLQRIRASKIGFIFQDLLLIPQFTVYDNIKLVMKFAKTDKKDISSRIEKLFEELNIPHLKNKYPKELSQGEKLRIAFLRAIANSPDLIIADEPTANLDTSQGLHLISLLHKYAKEMQKAVVIASHDLRITDYADNKITLRDGKVVSY